NYVERLAMRTALDSSVVATPGLAGDPSRVRLRRKPAPEIIPSTARKSRSAPAWPQVYIAAIAAGVVNSVAWLVPETAASALLGWLGACLLIYVVRARRAYLPAYCTGMVGHAIAFYWVYPTVSVFGKFGMLASAATFLVFVMTGALLLLVFAVVHHN